MLDPYALRRVEMYVVLCVENHKVWEVFNVL